MLINLGVIPHIWPSGLWARTWARPTLTLSPAALGSRTKKQTPEEWREPAGMRDPRIHDERGVKIPWALQKPPENGN